MGADVGAAGASVPGIESWSCKKNRTASPNNDSAGSTTESNGYPFAAPYAQHVYQYEITHAAMSAMER